MALRGEKEKRRRMQRKNGTKTTTVDEPGTTWTKQELKEARAAVRGIRYLLRHPEERPKMTAIEEAPQGEAGDFEKNGPRDFAQLVHGLRAALRQGTISLATADVICRLLANMLGFVALELKYGGGKPLVIGVA
jgi:hypothetical protein